MRLKVTALAATTVLTMTLALAGPLPAMATEATGTDAAEAPATSATEPTDPSGPDLIEVTTPDTTTPVPLPIDRVDLPLVNAPLFNLSQPTPPAPVTGPRLGGGAVGAYVETHVGDLGLNIGKVGGVYMPPTQGREFTEVSRIETPIWPVYGLVYTRAIESETTARRSPLSAESTSKIARVGLGPGVDLWMLGLPYVYFPVSVDALESSATVRQGPDGEFVTTAESKLGRLTINGKVSPLKDYAPNTTYNVSGLGKVVINEQQITRIPGEKYAAKVHALHITLSTATAGLPAGTDIYIGTAEAVVHL